MKNTVYIGVDDTDIIGSPGTGKVARGLAQMLSEKKLADSLGVSRHQLLVDPRVKYTSHNSCKGIAVITENPVAALFQSCIDFIEGCFQPGADPGLCICAKNQVSPEILNFGLKAEIELLTKQNAYELASREGIFLKELGGDGSGIIGALAAVGLRASGNNGRLVDIRGVREIKGIISVEEIKMKTGIIAVRNDQGQDLNEDVMIDSLDWVRPSLIGGIPVLKVVLSKEPSQQTGKRMWVPAEKALKGIAH
ncbi:MAG: hypothetical protein HQM08_24210 [Candidatus Riflebacteria bacterium]|nr:hypothetical protein [Candidatus Riflebacteria bacterium]